MSDDLRMSMGEITANVLIQDLYDMYDMYHVIQRCDPWPWRWRWVLHPDVIDLLIERQAGVAKRLPEEMRVADAEMRVFDLPVRGDENARFPMLEKLR